MRWVALALVWCSLSSSYAQSSLPASVPASAPASAPASLPASVPASAAIEALRPLAPPALIPVTRPGLPRGAKAWWGVAGGAGALSITAGVFTLRALRLAAALDSFTVVEGSADVAAAARGLGVLTDILWMGAVAAGGAGYLAYRKAHRPVPPQGD